MIIFLFSSQRIAIATGLASGATPPTGWPFILTISLIILYSLALIETGIMSILLVKKNIFIDLERYKKNLAQYTNFINIS